MRWFDDPHSPEFLQTSAKIRDAPALSTVSQFAGAVDRIWMAFRQVAPATIEISALAALSYGCLLAWKPLGFIVPGGIIMALSIYADLRRSAATRRAERRMGETKP